MNFENYVKRLNGNAAKMLQNPTPYESMFYERLDKANITFFSQWVIGRYIADFVIPETGLIIELNGSEHNRLKVRRYDAIRTKFLEDLGFKVIELQNDESRSFDLNNLRNKSRSGFDFNAACKRASDIIKFTFENGTVETSTTIKQSIAIERRQELELKEQQKQQQTQEDKLKKKQKPKEEKKSEKAIWRKKRNDARAKRKKIKLANKAIKRKLRKKWLANIRAQKAKNIKNKLIMSREEFIASRDNLLDILDQTEEIMNNAKFGA
jgi:very-short-patch-repair endonuclease